MNYGSFQPAPPRPNRRLSKQLFAGAAASALLLVAVVVLTTTHQDNLVLLQKPATSGGRSALAEAAASSSSASTPAEGGKFSISCTEAQFRFGPTYDAFRYATVYLQEKKGCPAKKQFVCDLAFEEDIQTRSLWLRGTCGDLPTVYAFHVQKPDLVLHRFESIGRGLDASLDVCPPTSVDVQGNPVPRTEYETLKCSFELLEFREVAASLADLAVPSESLSASSSFTTKVQPHMALMTKDEALKKLHGLRVPSQAALLADEVFVPPATSSTPHPANYNFVDQYPMCRANVIVSQGSCGSCYAFAAAKAYSGSLCQKTGMKINVDISEQQSVSCYNSNGCGGGWAPTLWGRMNAVGGFSTRRCLEYKALDADDQGGIVCGTGCSDDGKYKATKWYRVDSSSETNIEKALVQFGPLWITTRVCPSYYSYKTGIFDVDIADGCRDPVHAVALVGYTPTYWIIANSWGSSWGENGFQKVARGATKALNIAQAYAVVTETGIETCATKPTCRNGGVFKPDCSCWCPEGFTGADCTQCQRVCLNGGVRDPLNCQCTCAPGFFGTTCEEELRMQVSNFNTKDKKVDFKISNKLNVFFPPTSPTTNVVRRFTNPDFNVVCSNCASANITDATAVAYIAGQTYTSKDWSRDPAERCFSAELSRGKNEFGVNLPSIRVNFPCFTFVPNATYIGGYCIAGGFPITDPADPVYNYQCSAPPPVSIPCEDTPEFKGSCPSWNRSGYCAKDSVYYAYVSARCEATCKTGNLCAAPAAK